MNRTKKYDVSHDGLLFDEEIKEPNDIPSTLQEDHERDLARVKAIVKRILDNNERN